ncbi:MAG: hypothetical protein IJD93_06590 [Ruminococcus sp.]|nr:hypothetical protein [Ruminococcus sp.]
MEQKQVTIYVLNYDYNDTDTTAIPYVIFATTPLHKGVKYVKIGLSPK